MDDDYAVGYGKPPRNTRFQKGRSGNPAGTKQPRQSFGNLFDELLNENVVVTEQGQKRRMTKMRLVLSQLINKAGTGDAKNMRIFLDVMSRYPPSQDTVRIDREDEEFMAEVLRKYKELDDSV